MLNIYTQLALVLCPCCNQTCVHVLIMSNCIAIICDNFWDNLLTTTVKNNSKKKEKEKEKEERDKSIRELYNLKKKMI